MHRNGNNKLIGVPAPLPGMERVEEERAAARAEELQAQLTAELLRPKGSIEALAGTVETLSPLFRGSEASPQSEMFSLDEEQKL
jgi:hypothetical protein